MSLRQCLRERIPEIEIAAERLRDAVSAHLRGEPDVAEALFRLADNKDVRDWTESVWGRGSSYNRPRRRLAEPPHILLQQQKERQKTVPRYASRETERLVHQRDGHYCRFCDIPVIRPDVRKAIRKVYPAAVPWGDLNPSQHAGFQCTWAQYDHILPYSRGGTSDLKNIYLTCAPCNNGRGSFVLEEFDLIHPNLREPRQGPWDGLENFR